MAEAPPPRYVVFHAHGPAWQSDVARSEIEAFAAADPAVGSGLLRCEVCPQHTPFEA